MNPAIQIRHDRKRGCGYRKPGGLYLVAAGPSRPCGKLPIPLEICPTCGGGIHFCRSWTWVNGTALAAQKDCRMQAALDPDYLEQVQADCSACPLGRPLGRCGLLWIGEKFYATPADWTREAVEQGISRRIPAVPKDFEVGKTWVLVAHKKATWRRCPDCQGHIGNALVDAIFEGKTCETCKAAGEVPVPAIFHAFRPTAIEYVVTGAETDEEIEGLVKRGLTPIQVERVEEQPAGV